MAGETSMTGFPELTPTAGPLLIGYLMNSCLYGALVVQSYWYYMSFPRDMAMLKAFVAFLLLMETAQTAMVWNDALKGYALTFGDPNALDDTQLAWLDILIFSGIISFAVQSFFAFRIYSISKSKIAVVAVMSTALSQITLAIVTGNEEHMYGKYSKLQAPTRLPTSLWLASSALCDIIIAAYMIYYLSRMRERAFQRRTEVLLTRLMRLSIETGLMTAILGLITMILFITTAGTYFACLGATMAKVYSNVALAVLNHRIRVVNGRDWDAQTSVDLEREIHLSRLSDIFRVTGAERVSTPVDLEQNDQVYSSFEVESEAPKVVVQVVGPVSE